MSRNERRIRDFFGCLSVLLILILLLILIQMNTMFDHEELEVYQESLRFLNSICKSIREGPLATACALLASSLSSESFLIC